MKHHVYQKNGLKLFILFMYIMLVSCNTNNLNKNKNDKQFNNDLNQCATDANCNSMNICVNHKCVHKPFIPPSRTEIYGAVFIMIGSAISNAGGIGGGGLLIPILILILNFSTHEAIPISKLMIFTGASTAFIMGLKNKHPYRNGIPLDLNVAGILIPMLLFGTMVGVSLNKVMPPTIILISLTIVLVINTLKTCLKGVKLFKKENEEKEKSKLNSKLDGPTSNEEYQSLKSTSEDHNDTQNGTQNESKNGTNNDTQAEKDIETSVVAIKLLCIEYDKDKIIFPIEKTVPIILAFIALIGVSLLKGSEHFKSLINIRPCTSPYWLIYFILLPICMIITYYFSTKVLQEYRYRKTINYPYHQSDVKWTVEILVKYPIYAFFGGIMAGLLGIGGGLIFGPLLLEMGLNPLVSTATSNFLVLVTSFSTSVQFILIGAMNFNYGLFCTVCSTLGSYMGTVAIQRLLEKTGRTSVLIFTMAIVELISSICIPLHTYYEMKQNYSLKIDVWKFGSPC